MLRTDRVHDSGPVPVPTWSRGFVNVAEGRCGGCSMLGLLCSPRVSVQLCALGQGAGYQFLGTRRRTAPPPRAGGKTSRGAWGHGGPQQLPSSLSRGLWPDAPCCRGSLSTLCPRIPPGQGWGEIRDLAQCCSQSPSAQSLGLAVRMETWVSFLSRGRAVGLPIGSGRRPGESGVCTRVHACVCVRV